MAQIRTAREKDKAALYALWHEVFGDDAAFLDLYFGKYFDPAWVLVRERDGRIVSMCTLYSHAGLYANGTCLGTCPAVYAAATSHSSRGHGTGLDLMRRQLLTGACGEGNGFSMLSPAEESLYDLYAERLGMRDYFYAYAFTCRAAGSVYPQEHCGAAERAGEAGGGGVPAATFGMQEAGGGGVPAATFGMQEAGGAGISAATFGMQEAAPGCAPDPDGEMIPLSPKDYNVRRERLLRTVDHLAFTDRQIEMEADICALGGGGLFAVRCGTSEGLCAVEPTGGGAVRVNELLIEEDAAAAALLQIQAAFAAETYEVRMIPYVNQEKLLKAMEAFPGSVTDAGVCRTGMLFTAAADAPAGVVPDGNACPGDCAYAGFVYD